MIADELRTGDTFVRHSQIEWAAMSNRERKEAKRATVIARLGSCVTYERIHLRTSAGTWCIPKEAPVVLLTIDHKAKAGKAFAKRKPRKAA